MWRWNWNTIFIVHLSQYHYQTHIPHTEIYWNLSRTKMWYQFAWIIPISQTYTSLTGNYGDEITPLIAAIIRLSHPKLLCSFSIRWWVPTADTAIVHDETTNECAMISLLPHASECTPNEWYNECKFARVNWKIDCIALYCCIVYTV